MNFNKLSLPLLGIIVLALGLWYFIGPNSAFRANNILRNVDTSDWQTFEYSDQGLAFSLKYPDTWQVDTACNLPTPIDFLNKRIDDRECFIGWSTDSDTTIDEYYATHLASTNDRQVGPLQDIRLANGVRGKVASVSSADSQGVSTIDNHYFFQIENYVVGFILPTSAEAGFADVSIGEAVQMLHTFTPNS